MRQRIEIQEKQKFGRYTFIKDDEPYRQPNGKLTRKIIVKCECGKIKSVQLSSLIRGIVVSCGCFHKENASKKHKIHGENRKAITEYTTWQGMKTRCNNPKSTSYSNYGGKGIKVCERWNKYVNFLEDMGRKPGLEYTLDRIDSSKGYSKDNCRWETRSVQNSNRRPYTRRYKKENDN
jgi:hypothetical protein